MTTSDFPDLATTALVLIDIQKGIMQGTLAPHSIESIIKKNNQLADALKETDALIVPVSVDVSTFHAIGRKTEIGQSASLTMPADFKQPLITAAESTAANVVPITKYNPGAFFGTDLDLQLRRRGITTILLTGVSTTNGVYTTALEAYQRGYDLIVLEDACSDRDKELHQIFFSKLFPKISRIRTVQEVLSAYRK